MTKADREGHMLERHELGEVKAKMDQCEKVISLQVQIQEVVGKQAANWKEEKARKWDEKAAK